MPINNYLKNVKNLYKGGKATEHSYRGDLQKLIENLVPGIKATNEPKRIKCGAPDYIIERKKIPVGYIEAKDIKVDLNTAEKTDQLKRYKISLDNLILTDYLEFRFFKYGKKVKTIKIAEVENKKLNILFDNFDSFITHIKDFCSFNGQTIKSAEKLAKMMAQKARMMEEVIYKAVISEGSDRTLKEQLGAFQKILIHDLSEKDFADIYAQTISYGLFTARLHDETLEDFSRQEARDLIPRSNPFLRNLFDYVMGPQLDDRIVWIVDDLAEIFRATDVKEFVKNFGKATQQTDPFIHFYETFLAEYDPKMRRSRGVYYTPEPVVNFIVRAIDDILKTEFNLPQGLADTSKVEFKTKDSDNIKKIHKVQILDPAVGTGTFLAEIVKQIYKNFENQKGIWSSYVENELLPRLNGFEILMAPYTMCHLKLEVLLRQTGYKPKYRQQRLRVFLTNSLEEAIPYKGTLFASWLSKEALEANIVKNETPVMVILGNPPYANFGKMNQGEWIKDLIKDYKTGLNEKKTNIDDDYIKFIRYAEHFINKNSKGIVAMITNNSFIDGITHRQMRKQLLETFDKIYIIDLHGNVNKKEKSPDGNRDENVFDIQQGVSINLFIKNLKKSLKLANVSHLDIFGLRKSKYDFLWKTNMKTAGWNNLFPSKQYYFFVPKDFSNQVSYDNGFRINEIFVINNSGIETAKDGLVIQFEERIIKLIHNDFCNLEYKDLIDKYSIDGDKIFQVSNDLKNNESIITDIVYRPFDKRKVIYSKNSQGVLWRPRHKVMKHFIGKHNIGFCIMRQVFHDIDGYFHFFIVKNIVDRRIIYSNRSAASVFPLYLYNEQSNQSLFQNYSNLRSPNLDEKKVKQFECRLKLKFESEKSGKYDKFAPIDLFDYIYAVLHSPSYRQKYIEFLKIDFPRIPYPENKKTFWKLVKLGSELRQIHLLESPIVEKHITSYPIEGDNIVSKVKFEGDKKGKVWINENQYFDRVPKVSWEFYIGGYQPAQKWLKDRKGRELSFEDISHYQKIIVALYETDRIMKEIDKAWKF